MHRKMLKSKIHRAMVAGQGKLKRVTW